VYEALGGGENGGGGFGLGGGGGGGGGGEGGWSVQSTYTSSLWVQPVVTPQNWPSPWKLQSASRASLPVHATSSIQIRPLPMPYLLDALP
jgi:hypothetical protein